MCNYCGYGTYGYSPYQQYGYGYGQQYSYGASNYGLPGGYGASGAPFLATVVPVGPSFASFAPTPSFASYAPVAPVAWGSPRGEYRVGNCLCICQ